MTQPFAHWPNPLVMDSGNLIADIAQWTRRRHEIAALLLRNLYGHLPQVPKSTHGVLLHAAMPNTVVSNTATPARTSTYRINVDGLCAFNLRLLTPDHDGPFPVVLNGDSCWNYANDTVVNAMLSRGYAFAQFNRAEIMADLQGPVSQQAMSPALTSYGGGAIAAWAWGYHRAVDALEKIAAVDSHRLAVVGHSRGGKAALLAGALDERIALTSANNSGAAGAGSQLFQGRGSETIADLVDRFPHWLAGDIRQLTRHDAPPLFDQHFLRSLVAPRALLTTEALEDYWANPEGSHLAQQAAQPVFDFLGVPHHNAIAFRQGGHAHLLQDWVNLLDFADKVFSEQS